MITTHRGRDAISSETPSRWLFPGGLPGQHIHPSTLARRLRKLNISAAHLRTASIMDLAAEIPPAVLADLIGIYPTTAARWTHAAGGDWAFYVAARTATATTT